jgi:hypothetical protein
MLKSRNDKRLRDFDYQVLFAIFAIGIMFPYRFHKAREYSGRNRCPNFLFFAAEASLVPSDIAKLTKTVNNISGTPELDINYSMGG